MPRRHDGAGSVVLPYGESVATIENVLARLQDLATQLRREWAVQQPAKQVRT